MTFNSIICFSPASLTKILLSTFRNRSRTGIVVDILDTVKENPKGKTITQIMQSAKLNYDQVTKFVNLLMMCDLIRGEPINYGSRKLTYYTLTNHGAEFLRTLQKLQFTILLKHKAL